ncbi:hypothetical protein [Nostoc linckia]|uniref:hypothetical protein n=1 Tax=Nostoc linckia TaxID=92942 RepID=UPI0015D4DC8E|nr:hypothetical protein [Nostoc linckia]
MNFPLLISISVRGGEVWGEGRWGRWGDKGAGEISFPQCPNAPCPMPNAQYPILPTSLRSLLHNSLINFFGLLG